jgi:hypothetical protein
MISLVTATLSESDKRLLIITLIVFLIFFLILGLIGMCIRKTMQYQGKAIDKEVSDGVRYRVVDNPEHFKAFAKEKNRRLFFLQVRWPLLIGFVSLLFYLIYAGVTGQWSHNYFADYGTLFFTWDFGDTGSYANFWGMTLLAKWPPLMNTPHFVTENYASYILCTLWIIGGLYFLVVSQAYFSRMIMISQRARSVYNKSLDGYNFYDNVYPQPGQAVPPASSVNPTPPTNPK